MKIPDIIINGETGNSISSLDRGLLYGDGVFETIAVKQGQPEYYQAHLSRLLHGCDILGIYGVDKDILISEVNQLINTDQQCVIKIIITRGIGERGYKPTQMHPSRIIQKFPWPEFSANYTKLGIDITLCDFRMAKQSKLAKIKHLNRLEQVLARSEWDDEFQEGLVCDTENHIIEATSANVFFEINGSLVTPALDFCGVAGVFREQIIKYCRQHKIELMVRDVLLNELENVQAMFLCNSVIGIWPVKRIDKRILDKTAIIDKLLAVFKN